MDPANKKMVDVKVIMLTFNVLQLKRKKYTLSAFSFLFFSFHFSLLKKKRLWQDSSPSSIPLPHSEINIKNRNSQSDTLNLKKSISCYRHHQHHLDYFSFSFCNFQDKGKDPFFFFAQEADSFAIFSALAMTSSMPPTM